MIDRIRKRTGPVPLVLALGIIGVTAVLFALTFAPGSTQAQGPDCTVQANISHPECAQVADPFVISDDLTAPTNVTATSDEAGTLTLEWEGGENADFYILLAVDLAAYNAGESPYYKDASVNDRTARTGDVSALTSGKSYLGLVIAVKGSGADLEYKHGAASIAVSVQ